MRIKIHAGNTERIERALGNVNGRATAHTITLYDEVQRLAERAERLLAKYELPTSMRAGACIAYVPGGPSASAYKYDAVSTRVHIVRRSRAWYLVTAEREYVPPRQRERVNLTLMQHQIDEIVRRVIADITVACYDQEDVA